MLSRRREAILRIIVVEYIATAIPAASESMGHSYSLGISPATIRNEMALLEEEGYIARPHISAGSIPTDKGYRFYVESFIEEAQLPINEQQAIHQVFENACYEVEEWAHLASTILSRKVKNVAVVTLPRTSEVRFEHIELVSLRDFLIMLLVVLQGASLNRRRLTTDKVVPQEELTSCAGRFNTAFRGLTGTQIKYLNLECVSLLETRIIEETVQLMQAEDEQRYRDIYMDGLRHLVRQPEFFNKRGMADVVAILENKAKLHELIDSMSREDSNLEVKISIGNENKEEALQSCSVILESYGPPEKVRGTIGVIGPTRIPYAEIIPTVKCLSSVMNEVY